MAQGELCAFPRTEVKSRQGLEWLVCVQFSGKVAETSLTLRNVEFFEQM